MADKQQGTCPSCGSTDPALRNGSMTLDGGFVWCKDPWHKRKEEKR
jgi:hypothetical protein